MTRAKGNSRDAEPVNDAERLIREAASEGQWAEFSRTQEDGLLPRVRAVFLRHLLSDLSQSVHSWERSGLRIRSVHVEGMLELADWAGIQGTALPPLLLDKCEIPGIIDVSHAHLSRLSITNSRISHIQAEGVHIDGMFDFSGTRAYNGLSEPEEEGVAWIRARGAKIGGKVDGRGAQLRAPDPRPKAEVIPGNQRYALSLANSLIGGRVELIDGFQAFGGVSLGNAEVVGEVWLRGAELTAGEGDAFSAQSAKFSSGVALDEGFSAKGQVWMLGAKMAWLECGNASFENRTTDGTGLALEASGAEILGSVDLRGKKFKASGAVRFMGAKISGGFDCSNASFENRTENGEGIALALSNAEVGGDVLLGDDFIAQGIVILSGVRISRDLTCTSARFQNRTEDGKGLALGLALAQIGGNLNLDGEKFKASGQVDISSSRIAGNFLGTKATFENIFPGGNDAYSLVAWNTEVAGDFFLEDALCVGEASLWGLHVGRTFRANGTVFACSHFALTAPHLRVAGDLTLDNTKILGGVWLPHVEVSGDLGWDGLSFVQEYTRDGASFKLPAGTVFNLAHAKVGSSLKAKGLLSEVKLRVDLGDAHASALDDNWPTGWGGDAVDKGLVSLNVDGFVYDRVHSAVEESHWVNYIPGPVCSSLARLFKSAARLLFAAAGSPKQLLRTHGRAFETWSVVIRCRTNAASLGWRFYLLMRIFRHGRIRQRLARTRLEWLSLQSAGFVPQPYRHLARVLRTQGNPEAAREVGIAEGWRAPAEPWYIPIKIPFGVCFGFGLSPLRASLTLMAVFIVGWAGVHAALQAGVLSVTTSPVASIVLKGGRPQMAIQNGDPALATTEVTCTDEVEPALYAVDVMLPVISLHQETVCDVSIKPKFHTLKVGKFIFSALGKLAVALALITFSGVLKARAEE